MLSSVLDAPCVDEVIVVSDGSKDKTFEVAQSQDGVTAFELDNNVGKGGAMLSGVSKTDADIVVFFDGDLEGLKPEHVEALIKPLVGNEAEMVIGVFRGGKWNTTLSQIISPNISGQRAVRRELFLCVPHVENARYGVEVRINKFFKRRGYRVKRVILQGVTHTVKEAKIGKVKGSLVRARMYYEIFKVYFFDKSA